jgi:DNA-binding transcriptional MocR family regulator
MRTAVARPSAHHISSKASQFTESVIREMTRLAIEHGAMNLAQGFPDFAAPAEVKEAAQRAIAADINQYAITWGAREFRRAIAGRFSKDTGIEIDPEREITVTCGATEAMIASLLKRWWFSSRFMRITARMRLSVGRCRASCGCIRRTGPSILINCAPR